MAPNFSLGKLFEFMPSSGRQWGLIAVTPALAIVVAYFGQDLLTYLFDEVLMVASCLCCFLLMSAKDKAAKQVMRRVNPYPRANDRVGPPPTAVRRLVR